MGLGCQMNEVESQFCISGPRISGSVRNVRRLKCALMLQISLPARSDIIWIAWLSLVIPPYWRPHNCDTRNKQPGPGEINHWGNVKGGCREPEQGRCVDREVLK